MTRVLLPVLLLITPGCFDSPLAAWLEEQRIQDTPDGIAWTRVRRAETAADVRRIAARARKVGRTPIYYMKASWCSACKLYEKRLTEPAVIAGHAEAHLIELDIDQHRRVLSDLGHQPRSVPTFTHVDLTSGQAVGPTMTSAAWGPDTPQNIGRTMAGFVGR